MVVVPYTASLFLPIDVGKELEDFILEIPVLCVNAHRKLLIHVVLNGGLWIGHNKVNLVKGPME